MRCPRLGGLLIAAVVGAFALHPDLAGREHMVALAVGAIGACVSLRIPRKDANHAPTIAAASMGATCYVCDVGAERRVRSGETPLVGRPDGA
jgi:hypothetical protein